MFLANKSPVFRAFSLCCCLSVAQSLAPVSQSASREVHLHQEYSDVLIQVEGDDDDDWHFFKSTDLTNWVSAPELGTLLSGRTNAPVKSLGELNETPLFYRAER